jgi:beta-1,2-mannobiose phosphorylase / 1,2-beta-oligomannan phosphorylase
MFVIRREPHNPVLTPRHEHPWETLATYNPSVIRENNGWRMYYRALSNPAALVSPYAGQSSIGEAFSEDGVHFNSRRQVLMAEEPWEAFGCEDPRATVFEGVTYLTYTALGGYPFSKDNIKVGIAVAKDGKNFTERHLVTPFNAKAFAIFPERVGGKVAAFLAVHTDDPPAEICIVYAESVEDFWSPAFWAAWYSDWKSHKLVLKREEKDHVEVGSVPVLTQHGWLIFYSYIENYFSDKDRVFTIEAALLDRDDPLRIISRTESLMVPEDIYERYGLVPDIVFPTSATIGDNGLLDIWYGAADTVCAKASVRLHDLMRALDPERPARTFNREAKNPILTPQGDGFESRNVMNAAAIELNGVIYILYRAMDNANTSTIGLAISKDGVSIEERLPAPIYAPRESFEAKRGSPTGNSGCEDPRIVRIGDMLHMTYTAYDGVHSPAGAVTSISVDDFLARRFEKWGKPHLLTPDNVDDKDLALLPEMVNGNYLLYHRVSSRMCADVLPDLTSGTRVSRCIEIIGPRTGMWDGVKVGSAAPPIKIGDKWLMIYHGVSRHSTYRLGAVLLGADGTSVLSRTADPVFEPLEKYEQQGEVPNVVFSCGAVVRGDIIYLYYGAADKVIGVATASLAHMLDALS